MTEQIDMWRAADLLVKWHGDDAAGIAARRADERIAQGDVGGQMIWKRFRVCLVQEKDADDASRPKRDH